MNLGIKLVNDLNKKAPMGKVVHGALVACLIAEGDADANRVDAANRVDGEKCRELLNMAVVLIEQIQTNLGLAGLIDASTGTGMTHIGLLCWLKDVKKIIND